jgi:hypothetical protein
MSEKAATVEIHFSGALASGIPLEFDAVDVFDFDDDGLIVRLTSWYDSHAVRSSLKRAVSRWLRLPDIHGFTSSERKLLAVNVPGTRPETPAYPHTRRGAGLECGERTRIAALTPHSSRGRSRVWRKAVGIRTSADASPDARVRHPLIRRAGGSGRQRGW